MIYNHNLIEKKWQKYWEEKQTYKFVDNPNNDKKTYILEMFPYPSGSGLHVGHLKGWLAGDVLARFKRMQGYDVLHPMGWDAFGLPAEQYAIKTGNHPATFTYKNIDYFRNQLKKVGFCYDYNKEVCTCDEDYYAITQWIFTKLYEHGLAEIKEIEVNWCPELKIVLANEEVIIKDGKRVSERGEHPVVYKPMRQWVLKITNYAEKLLEGLEEIEWPEGIKELQKNWIGKSIGTQLQFPLAHDLNQKLEVFTTRIDTIYGVKFILIAPDHPLINELVTANQKAEFDQFYEEYEKLSLDKKANEKTKIGCFTGSYVINPITQEKIPLWTTNYVLKNYGTGVVMSVPAHDERDYEFALKYNLPIYPVIETKNPLPYEGDGIHINSELINGLKKEAAIKKLNAYLVEKKLGEPKIIFRLKDWIFSRQRYWGEPIPVYFDENNKIYVEKKLPLVLPKLDKIEPSNNGKSPLDNAKNWINFEIDNKKYFRDSNTMPNWAGSSWYYLAYILRNDDQTYTPIDSPLAYQRFQKWLPVDYYIGGQEHAVLHCLYARFWHRFLYDLKIVPTKEPFFKLINQGMILGSDGSKMSKSLGNIINPDDIVESHGADSLRLYQIFMGPVTASLPWNESGLNSMRKWVEKVYNLFTNLQNLKLVDDNEPINRKMKAKLLANIENGINKMSLNNGVSEMMIYVNELQKNKTYSWDSLQAFVQVLSLYAPHLSEELWSIIFKKDVSVFLSQWPTYNKADLIENTYELPVQINGKLKFLIEVEQDWDDEKIKQELTNNAKFLQQTKNKEVVKIIIVSKKIINIILK